MADDLGTVLVVLAALKRERVPFRDAWAVALPAERLPTGERSSVRLAFDATAEAWRRACVGEPPSAGETAAAFLFAAWSERDDAEDRGELVGVRCG